MTLSFKNGFGQLWGCIRFPQISRTHTEYFCGDFMFEEKELVTKHWRRPDKHLLSYMVIGNQNSNSGEVAKELSGQQASHRAWAKYCLVR
jgi:hypothetical protein